MQQSIGYKNQEEWLRVLGKGMVTLPKRWRDELGISTGDVIKAKKKGSRVIIEPPRKSAPYRVYSDQEIAAFLKDDAVSPSLARKVKKHLRTLGSRESLY